MRVGTAVGTVSAIWLGAATLVTFATLESTYPFRECASGLALEERPYVMNRVVVARYCWRVRDVAAATCFVAAGTTSALLVGVRRRREGGQ
jgi:hypothetical protein